MVSSVAEFVGRVMNWRSNGAWPVAFRGQGYVDWITIPKIFRPEVGLYEDENNAVRDLIAIHPQEFQSDSSMFDRLVRMQHFDLPTRLLDVTTNPLVALYFSTSDYIKSDEHQDGKVQAFFLPANRRRYFDSDLVSCMANFANLTLEDKKNIHKSYRLDRSAFNKVDVVQRLIQFVRAEKPHFEAKIDPSDLTLPVYVHPKMSNRRIIAQSGAFIIYGFRRLRGAEVDKGLRVQRIVIPADKKKSIRMELERLGIHASALFPEIDKAADFIVRRYATKE